MNNDLFYLKFSKFISTVIVNASIDYFRKKKKTEEREQYIDIQEETQLSKLDNCVSSYAYLEEKIDYINLENIFEDKKLYLAIKSLTERQKYILYLNIVEEMSAKDISKLLNISEDTVWVTKAKSLKSIRNFVNNYGGNK